MSMNVEGTADTPASLNPERIEDPNKEISHKLLEERIMVMLGPLNEQISTLTQLLNQLI